MKKILIISPHYPPSNLAAVHRSRLFAQHLPVYGWQPVILTVHEKYYEETLDWNLCKLIPQDQQIEKVKAFKITKPRFIGDIGLRAFFFLYKKAKQLIEQEKIDFLYIPIPSFYVALLGRWLHQSTGIKYGIDYIDPWVHTFPGSEKIFSRHWLSTRLARSLEPVAIKKASLITGVAEGYYQGVVERNPHLKRSCLFGAMPYGGEQKDYEAVDTMNLAPYLFKKNGKLQLVYAGAMLPKAYPVLEQICSSIRKHSDVFADVEFHFIGTGKAVNEPSSYTIKPYAVQYGLWEKVIFEYPQRIPYLDVLIHLKRADAVFVLGSTEPHYTPSKIYQGILAGKAIMAILHEKSTASEAIRSTHAGMVLDFNEGNINTIESRFSAFWKEFNTFRENFRTSDVDQPVFNQYSASNVTAALAVLLDKVTT